MGARVAAREMASSDAAAGRTRAEALQGHYAAERRLTAAFFRRGLPGGLRVGLVVSGFIGAEMVLAASRGRSAWTNGLAAGILTGVLYGAAGTVTHVHTLWVAPSVADDGARRWSGRLGRLGMSASLQLLGMSTVCGAAYGLAQDARQAVDAARTAATASSPSPPSSYGRRAQKGLGAGLKRPGRHVDDGLGLD